MNSSINPVDPAPVATTPVEAVQADHGSRGPYRVEANVSIQWVGPLHVGTGERMAVATDSPLLTDSKGRPALPGSSVRGVLRDWCERELPLLGLDRGVFVRLFGPETRDAAAPEADRQGRLTVYEAALEFRKVDREIRDHVRLDERWGAAAGGGKFDQEVALCDRGTVTLLYEGYGPNDPELRLLRAGIGALEAGVLAFGGKTGWGIGAVDSATVEWRCKDRSRSPGLASYLAARLSREAIPPDEETAVSNTAAATPTPRDDARLSYPRRRPWCWLKVDLTLLFDGPMLVAGPYRGEPADAALRGEVDHAYMVLPDGTPVLPGSSLRGVLRHHALRIASTLGQASLAQALFGLRLGQSGRCGLVRVGEGRIWAWPSDDRTPFVAQRIDHVAIDRLTNFAADKKVFNTGSLESPRFRHRLVVRWHPDDQEQQAAVALLLFVLRDAEAGLLWVGSRNTRGYGHVKGIEGLELSWSLVVPAEGTGRPFRAPSVEVKTALLHRLQDEPRAQNLLQPLMSSWCARGGVAGRQEKQ